VIVDTFAGPGGWDHALALLGHDAIGIEHDAAACTTRAAAGLTTIRADVAAYPLEHFPEVDGLIASPPCQAFSKAGKRRGHADLPRIYAHVAEVERAGAWLPVDPHVWADPRSELILEPLRWALGLRPRWIACEQVPDVLPFWQRLALVLEGLGYRTWAGELNAADYGVPQTRKRAILTARRDGPACFAPPPTHAKDPGEGLFDMLEPWVSMAEALGWGMTARPYPTIATSRSTGGPDKEKVGGSGARAAIYEERDAGRWTVSTGANSMKHSRDPDQIVPYERPLTEPAPAVTHQANAWWLTRPARLEERQANGAKRRVDQPAQTITASADNGNYRWVFERPATTVVGSFRPDVIAAPGWRTDPDDSRQDAEGSVRVTIPEVLVLQGFPPDYPLRGSKTKQYEQVGNAIPPPLAAAILAPLL
jgi:DNA (cytosine-5)-methyltransferase 1